MVAERCPYELGGGIRRQCAQGDADLRVVPAGGVVCGGTVGGPGRTAFGEFPRAVGLDDQEREFAQAGGEPGEPGEGFAVGPVRVVDDEDDRPVAEAGDEPANDPVEAVPDALRVGLRAGRLGQSERGGGDLVPVAEQFPYLVAGDPVEGGAEQLAVQRSAAIARISSSSAVLPSPASPLKTSSPPAACAPYRASTACAAAASSGSRSYNGRDGFMPALPTGGTDGCRA